MIILHFHLQPQLKYELFHIYFKSMEAKMGGISFKRDGCLCFELVPVQCQEYENGVLSRDLHDLSLHWTFLAVRQVGP